MPVPLTRQGRAWDIRAEVSMPERNADRKEIGMARDTTVKKVQSAHSPLGDMGQKYLVSGRKLSMRLWEGLPSGEGDPPHSRDYETIGYAISGRAWLEIEGQRITLEPGDCWLVPAGARHRYVIEAPFTAVEATSPPAQVAGDGDPH
jgi:quercetin dioxygenase-like cupin family protein